MGLKSIVVLALLSILTASCKLEIEVPEGGSVTTRSGAYACSANSKCVINIVDIFFDETFIAVPQTGYAFESWKRKDFAFCGNSANTCYLSTAEFGNFSELMSILESDQSFYLEPVFTPVRVKKIGFQKFETTVSTPGLPWLAHSNPLFVADLAFEIVPHEGDEFLNPHLATPITWPAGAGKYTGSAGLTGIGGGQSARGHKLQISHASGAPFTIYSLQARPWQSGEWEVLIEAKFSDGSEHVFEASVANYKSKILLGYSNLLYLTIYHPSGGTSRIAGDTTTFDIDNIVYYVR